MEALRNFWEVTAPYFGIGGLIGFFVTVFILPFFKGKVQKASAGFERALEKHDEKLEKAATEAADKAVEKIKNVSFKQSIQPIVESGLEKVTEKANEHIDRQVNALRESNEKIVAALAALGAYFEDSIVPDAKKQAFYAAIAAAQAPITEQEITVEETPVEATTTSPAAKKPTKKSEVIR